AWLGDVLSRGDGVLKDPAAALGAYRQAAEQGHVGALNRLTRLVMTQDAPPETKAEGVQLWLRAAEAGEALAQRMVGDYCLNGVGVEPDLDRAAHWLRLSAGQGNAAAKLILAGLILTGRAAANDPHEAVDLLREAAAEDNPDAEYNLGV